METKELNLYKVYAKGWNQAAYVAAENQQQAIEKTAPYYDTEFPEHMNIEWVADIIV
jgi:hypothetical protein